MNIPFLKNLSAGGARKGREAGTIHPRRDWLLLLGVTLLLFVALSVWSYLSFLDAVRTDGSDSSDGGAAQSASTSLESVRAIFEGRALLRNEYQTTRHFIDPSK